MTRDQAVFISDVISRVLAGDTMTNAECAKCYGVFGLKQLQDGLQALRREFFIPDSTGEIPR